MATPSTLSPELVLAHGNGQGDMTFARDGSLVVTCGADGRICLHSTKAAMRGSDDSATTVASFDCPAAPVAVTVVEASGSLQIVTACEDRQVSMHDVSVPGAESGKWEVLPGRSLGRLTLPPLALSANADQSLCGMTGEDPTVRLVRLAGAGDSDGTTVEAVLDCGRPNITGLAFDPKDEYVAAASTAGTVRVLKIRGGDEVRVLNFTPPTSAASEDPAARDPSKVRWRPSWHPKAGAFLALPGDNDVRVVKRGSWSLAFMLRGVHTCRAHLTTWSPNGLYLATADISGTVAVWDATTRHCLSRLSVESGVQGLSFCPAGNAIGIFTCDGEFAVCSGAVPADLPAPSDLTAVADIPVETEPQTEEQVAQPQEVQEQAEAPPAATEEAADAPESSVAEDAAASVPEVVAPPARKKSAASSLLSSDDDDDDDDDDVSMNIDAIKAKILNPGGAAMPADSLVQDVTNDQAAVQAAAAAAAASAAAAATPMQVAFQPGATYPPEGVKRRFLAWNPVGSITTREEQGYHAVEIEFADAAQRRPIRVADNHGFVVAALGDNGAFFASDEKSGSTAVLHFLPFNNWAHNADWTKNLPQGESVDAVAAGGDWCAAATSAGYLRCFRNSGMQLAPILTPGDVVCMVGAGPLLFIVYHIAAPSSANHGGSQHLGFVVYDVDVPVSEVLGCAGLVPRETGRGTLCLPGQENHLEWVGFATAADGTADASTVFAFDSSRRLLRLSPADGLSWQIAADGTTCDELKARPDTTPWIVGISHGRLMCTICKGRTPAERQPKTYPRPLLSAIPFSIPIIPGASDAAGAAEAKLLEQAIGFSRERRSEQLGLSTKTAGDETLYRAEVAMDSMVLQMMKASIKADNIGRALDLATRLHLERSFGIAMKMARVMGQEELATRVFHLMKKRMEEIMVAHSVSSSAPGTGTASEAPPKAAVPAPASVIERMSPSDASSTMETGEEPAPLRESTGSTQEGRSNFVSAKKLLSKKRKRAHFARGTARQATANENQRGAKNELPGTPGEAGTDNGPRKSAKTQRKAPTNPFLKQVRSSPMRRKGTGAAALLSNIVDGSPSPSGKGLGGKPVLSRQSSFAQRLRSKNE